MKNYPYFEYQNGRLFCEGSDVALVAQKQGTPLYVYSYQAMVDQYKKLDTAFAEIDHLICYAVKANTNKAILTTFFNLGCGADVVSGGELLRSLQAGCPANKIVFSGVGKTNEEIHLAIQEGILQFNVECEQELLNIQRIAKFLDEKARIAIRVNPDVDPKTHPYISTGLKTEKFGVDIKQAVDLYQKAQNLSHIEITGIHCHIGSQILETTPFEEAFQKIKQLVLQLKDLGISLSHLDIGGGFGIAYQDEVVPEASEYAKSFIAPLKELGLKIIIEPGRFLVGNAGVLVTKVLYGKTNSEGEVFTLVDAGMADLIRPMLYQAKHKIVPVEKFNDRKTIRTHIAGPYCESTDVLARDLEMPVSAAGEYLAVMSAGAYGMSMASLYNSRGRASEVMIKDKMFYIIKKPDRLEDYTKQESVPEFLKTQV